MCMFKLTSLCLAVDVSTILTRLKHGNALLFSNADLNPPYQPYTGFVFFKPQHFPLVRTFLTFFTHAHFSLLEWVENILVPYFTSPSLHYTPTCQSYPLPPYWWFYFPDGEEVILLSPQAPSYGNSTMEIHFQVHRKCSLTLHPIYSRQLAIIHQLTVQVSWLKFYPQRREGHNIFPCIILFLLLRGPAVCTHFVDHFNLKRGVVRASIIIFTQSKGMYICNHRMKFSAVCCRQPIVQPSNT